jgi:hypothetical protein
VDFQGTVSGKFIILLYYQLFISLNQEMGLDLTNSDNKTKIIGLIVKYKT